MDTENVPIEGPITQSTSVIEWTGLAPIPAAERHGKPWHVGGLWFAAQLVPSALFLGVIGGPGGLNLNFWAAVAAIVLGNVLGVVGPAALSLTGPVTGLPCLAQSRVPFGRLTGVAGVLAALTSIAFIALGAIFGAQALEVAFGLNPTVAILLVFLLEGLVSVAGYRILHLFERVMAFVVAAGFILITVVVLANVGGVQAAAAKVATGGVGSFFLLAAISFGFSFGWAHNAPDYCRYLPQSTSKPRLFWATFIGIAVACTWVEILGLTASSLLTGSSPMASIFGLVGGGAVGVLVMIAMYLGVVANAAVAQYSAGLQILGAGIRLPRPLVTAIVAAVALALTLYLDGGNLSDKFTNVLLLATYWIGPFVGIWIVVWARKPDLALFMKTATTRNSSLRPGWAALAAIIIGYLGALPFSSTAVGSDLAQSHNAAAMLVGSVSRQALDGADLAYPVGILLGALVFAVLTRGPFTKRGDLYV